MAGFLAAAILALIEAILALIGLTPAGSAFFAASLAETFLTTAVAFLRAALAATSLALMAAFLAGAAALRAFLRAATFLAALSYFFNAATFLG